MEPAFAGADLGSSGCRVVAIDAAGRLLASSRTPFAPAAGANRPRDWWQALCLCLRALPLDPGQLRALAVDATSGSVLAADPSLRPLGAPLMYHQPPPPGDPSAPDGLRRWLWLARRYPAALVFSQAGWLNARLAGRPLDCDYHNALKLGADVSRLEWPARVSTALAGPLPRLCAPGTPIGSLCAEAAAATGLAPGTRLCAGTTDGNAAFLASGASQPGDAVSSLGTTLVLKILSPVRIEAPEFGVYSHRYGDLWLVSGASNAGAGVLAQFFNPARLRSLSERIDAGRESGLDYYPLPRAGERFPLADPKLAPRLRPRPAAEVLFLHGMLEGLARIEAAGYRRLVELGAPPPRRLFSIGGGAANPAWFAIRQRLLPVPLEPVADREAAYGTARLAAGLVAL
ncbi:MAG: FGGY-family carbohydrate kinase [Gammaproteobacteria bacterium]|nr:FGGY-family carbohydrate kinase [Gammaproteobacteria bacterium]